MANYDILGNIAIVKFPKEAKKREKLEKARELLGNKSIKTVLEKTNKVSGRLRTIRTKYILGEKTKIAFYRENGCLFKFNVETCYFSPRLANERLEVAKEVKKGENVLVMFAGVAPFSIILAKTAKPRRIVSVELGKECCKYAEENIVRNKVENMIQVLQGDVKRIVPKLEKQKEKFDFIVMPRPNLNETFLKSALSVSKKGTRIVYYGFSSEDKKNEMVESLLKEAKKFKRKIKIVRILEAGDIAPYEHRYRIEMIINN
jgi:tRNA (guanine37-N1)-methyltransferase